jgi:flagellar export protein FliJ
MAGTVFRFDLDPVLQVRDRAVDAAREALGRAVRERAAQEAALGEVDRALAALLASGGAQTVRDFGAVAAHRAEAARSLAGARCALDRRRAAEAAARRALADALRQREALGVLRDEAAAAHRAEAARAEAATLDDLATTRARAA